MSRGPTPSSRSVVHAPRVVGLRQKIEGVSHAFDRGGFAGTSTADKNI
jgi:hypothetical protein